MTESDLLRRIQLDLVDEHTRIWRNNVGQGWQGNTFAVRNGVLISGEARRVHYGLATGSGDLIGIHNGLFVSLEVKSARGRVSPQQQAFAETVTRLGGRAGVVRSVDEAIRIVTGITK